MDQPNHQQYYVARAATSRDLAQRAADPAISAIHADFAKRYEMLAAQPGQGSDGAMTGVQAT